MTTDTRTNEPSEAMILAALNAYSSKGLEIDGYDPVDEYPSLDMWGERFASQMRAALVAAQGAARPVNSFDTTAEREKNGGDSLHVAPQEPSGVTDTNGHSWMTWEESGKNGTYCRSCGGWSGKVGNRQCSPAPPTDRQKLIDEAQAFERAPKLGLSAHRELDKAILLIRRLWPALDAPLDPVKVQDHLYFALRDSGYGRATSELLASVGTRALCEAYTEGKLT